MNARFTFLSGARVGQVEIFHKSYIGLGRHPLSDLRFDPDRDKDVSARHASVVRQGDAFLLRDLGSTNGTFVNGTRVAGDVSLKDGDVIAFGRNGPALEFRVVAAESGGGDTVPDAVRQAAERISSPRAQYPRVRRSSTAVRIAAEVARQTLQLRRTTKLLIAVLVATLVTFAWVQRNSAREATDLARFQSELASVRDALRQAQAEVARVRAELAASSTHDAETLARLHAQLDSAEARRRGLAGAAAVDYRAIAQHNQDAVALLVVAFSDRDILSGTAFAVDSAGTLVTNKHVLVREDGTRRPERIAVKFSGSRQWFPGRLVGVADSADIGLVRVDIRGGTPRVTGIAGEPGALARGDPVAIIGYPLGEDLPMERLDGGDVVADPTLTVGTVSKVLGDLVQVDGYGAPGSSGSPIFDRKGRVVAVLYGGNRESQGKIIYAVPAAQVSRYLRMLGP